MCTCAQLTNRPLRRKPCAPAAPGRVRVGGRDYGGQVPGRPEAAQRHRLPNGMITQPCHALGGSTPSRAMPTTSALVHTASLVPSHPGEPVRDVPRLCLAGGGQASDHPAGVCVCVCVWTAPVISRVPAYLPMGLMEHVDQSLQVYATIGHADGAISLGTGFERVRSPDVNLTPSWDHATMFELYAAREAQRMPVVDLVCAPRAVTRIGGGGGGRGRRERYVKFMIFANERTR
jgi:hypothetical protein